MQNEVHQRECWNCKNIATHTSRVAPGVCCARCGSQDTRRIKGWDELFVEAMKPLMATTIALTIQEHCMKPIGQLIKKARIKAKVTQVKLAKKIGVTQGAIYQFEQADTLQIATVEKIAKALKVTLCELLECHD